MPQKPAHVVYETKTSQNQNHGHFEREILQPKKKKTLNFDPFLWIGIQCLNHSEL